MEANSKLEINDGAELRIRGNSNLQLEENSVLVIKEGGKVIIENTGVLLYNGNAAITLTDANSVIEMENGGKIKINANTTFSYTGNGYLLVEDNWPYKTNIIAGGPNAKFSVDGINKRKVMEVIGNEALYPSDDLSLFEIKNAKVILNAGTRIIAGCPISLYNVDILPNPNFPSLKHRGLHLFGQKTDLSVLKVVGGIKGVTAYNNVFGNELNILAFTANECDQGLWVNDKGVNIISGTFKNNVNQGMFLNAQSLPSELSSITAKFNLSGADIIGNKGAIARFFYPDIQYNGSGIYADNSTISANCGNIKNSNNYNVYLRNNSLLDLDPAQILGAGLIDFSSTGQYSTPYLIRLDKAAHGPYLNNAKSNFTSGSWRIWGDLRDISSLVSFLYYNVNVNQNFWTTPTGVTLPIFNSHYRVKYIERSFPFSNPAIRDLLYIDNTPLSTAPNTTNCNPFNGTTMSVTYGVSTKYTQDGRNLNDILKSGLDRIYGIQPNIPGAVHDFNDILQTTFTANELNEWTVPILYTFDKLYEAIARGLKDSTYWVKNQDGSNHAIFTSTIDLYDIWINNFNSNAPVGYTLKLNKALFNRLFNNRTECLNQLNCLTNIVDSMDMALLEYYQCVVDKEIKMSNGLLDREIYNTFDECIAMLNIPSNRTIPNEEYLGKRNSKGMQEQVAPISPLLIFNLFPNPATNQLYIAFNSSGYGNFTLEIFDILGNKKITINKPSEKDNHFAIEIDNLSAGAYFIKTSVDGLIRLDKFIVAK
jgi:hypothetical protein